MTKKITILLMAVIAIISCSCLTSCGNDDDSKATEGTWYLVDYGTVNNVTCTWGEFITFTDTDMVWGLRDRGSSASYFRYTCSGKKIKCVALDGSDDITFTIKSVSGDKMTTTSTDNIERHWRR